MPHVVSTLSNDQEYIAFDKPASKSGHVARPAVAVEGVTVKGGANVMGDREVPEGVLTKITEKQAEFLRTNKAFARHQKAGYVKIVAAEDKPAKLAKNMTQRDNSAPLNLAFGDFEAGGRASGGPAPKQIKTLH